MARRRGRKIPVDTERRDRTQFLALRRLQAQSRGKSYNDKQVIDHARIEWERMRQADRRKQSRTKHGDDLMNELVAPDLQAVFEAFESAMSILSHLPERERTILNMMFVGSYSRTEVADALDISPKTVSETRSTALDRLRQTLK